jgi:NADH-quinone oxidoreductase subunit G
MPTIYIENKPYEVKEGHNLLETCLSLGFDVPYFCWHPAMRSVGACRQCAVKQFKDENDKRGNIVMSCMTPAAEGTRISIYDEEVLRFRKSVIEWLMLNHPHDCPVCDEGGECHLQDMTLMTGHAYRRNRFKKRTYRSQYLGPFVNHELNRCIQCYRCTRFYNDYAGGRDFGVFGIHDHVYFGRHSEGVLESSFSGNLVEVCPTGVFTDKTLKKHYTRKWDLTTAPSVCPHCSLGCNTIPGARYGMLRQVRNRYNGEVNGYFLCDRGRYGYEFVNSEDRITAPLKKAPLKGETLSFAPGTVLPYIKEILKDSKGIIGIGSERASMESNYALLKLVGAENFYQGVPDTEFESLSLIREILLEGQVETPSLKEIRESDAVLVLGEDISNTAPVLALAIWQAGRNKPLERAMKMHIPEWDDTALRNAIQDEKGPVFVISYSRTWLDEIAHESFRAAPDNIARIGFAIAHEIDGGAPAVEGLNGKEAALARKIAEALASAKRPVIVSGTGAGSPAILRAAANAAFALNRKGIKVGLSLALPACNSMGLALLGGKPIKEAFKRINEGEVETVIVLENDPLRSLKTEAAKTFLGTKNIIILDHLINPCMENAGIILPAATFAESDGTFVNNEGRAQRFYKVIPAKGECQESWRWIRDIMLETGMGPAEEWMTFEGILNALSRDFPELSGINRAAPPAGFRIAGMKVPREPHRHSGRTAMHADISVFEPRTPQDPDTPLSFSMEGFEGVPPAPLISHYWSPGWNSVQSLNKFQEEVVGPLKGGDPGKRLIVPKEGEAHPYFTEIPSAFSPLEGEFLFVPFYHVFGSEELSVKSAGITELAPAPYAALSSQDASKMGLKSGGPFKFEIGGEEYCLPLKVDDSLPGGIAGIPAGVPGLVGLILPEIGRPVRQIAEKKS